MKTTIGLTLGLMAAVAVVGCSLTVQNPYPVPPPEGGGPAPPPQPPPQPPPPVPPPGPGQVGGFVAPGVKLIPQGPLTGTVRWGGMHIVPPAAVLRIELRDEARLHRIMGRIAHLELTHFGHSPVQFKLQYDRSKMDADRDYVVIARLVVNGQVRRRIEKPVRVITKGRPRNVTLTLERPTAQ